MTSDTRTTTDRAEIREWVERQGGAPATVRDTEDGGTGVLRIDFPGGAWTENLRPIDWDTWFETFDREQLAFVYQVEKASGDSSTFVRLVHR